MNTEMLIKQFEESLVSVKEMCTQLENQLNNLKCATEAHERKNVYEPEEGDSYAFVDDDGTVNYTVNTNGFADRHMLSFGNVFPETDNIKEHLTKYSSSVLRVQNKLMQLHELLCPEYFPNWDSMLEQKFVVYYNTFDGWKCTVKSDDNIGIVCFTPDAAQEACDILNREQFKP